jgi:murein DD-endopeptidase MepM/ murein hydrolase activator NlpD
MLAVKEFANGQFVGYGTILYAEYKGKMGNHEATRFQSPGGRIDYYDEKGKSLRKVFLRSALQYRRISSYFSRRRYHPILRKYLPHHGVDYSAPVGTPVSAIGDGVVTFAGWKGAYGKLVYLKHKAGYQSGYGHLSKFAKGIKKGARVKQGQLIAYVGNTGRSTGPHLHFEMKRYGNRVNPLRVRIPAADPVSKKNLPLFQKQRRNIASLAKAYELMETTRQLAEMSRIAVVKDSSAAEGTD